MRREVKLAAAAARSRSIPLDPARSHPFAAAVHARPTSTVPGTPMLSSAPRSLRIAVQLLFLAVIAGAIYFYVPAVGHISPEAWQHSLAREAGGATDLEFACTERTDHLWRCPVHDPEIQGSSIVYELRERGRRCWDAVQVDPGRSSMRSPVSGCVGARDQMRLERRF
jgi:hypothetical protein